MSTVIVLGPGVDYTEPTDSDPALRVGVIPSSPAVLPGGRFRYQFVKDAGQSVYPTVHVVYAPVDQLPDAEEQTPEFFLGSSFPKATSAPEAPAPYTQYEVIVPDVEKGVAYRIQTVLQYGTP